MADGMGEILAVALIAALLVGLSVTLHYSALRQGARVIMRSEIVTHRPMLVVLALVFVVHLAEVLLFAVAYFLMHWSVWFGILESTSGAPPDGFSYYFYFSISAFTTLGFGDIVPVGAIRILAGVEALTGLVLIAWSASFSYLLMERLWQVGVNE